jgi:hypothetical protein
MAELTTTTLENKPTARYAVAVLPIACADVQREVVAWMKSLSSVLALPD